MDIEIIKKYLPNLEISEKQIEQLNKYYEFLVEQNELYNLTAITNKEVVYIKHFLDSLLFYKNHDFEPSSSICDIGSGAGFPGVVLKIFAPSIKLTIIEALEKRCNFLKKLVDYLELKDVEIIHSRAEVLAIQKPNQFDYVFSRAVANLRILLELCIGHVKQFGYIVCYKGPNVENELNDSQNAIKVLNLTLSEVQHENIKELGIRNICYFQKLKNTMKYPRSFAQIKKSPL